MTPQLRTLLLCLLAVVIAVPLDALAESGKWAASEHPLDDVAKQPTPKPVTYGLCDAPQNADAFPSSPVRVVETTCDFQQKYSATSNKPSTGGSCGGFTVAFGPKGDLKPHLYRITLAANWGDQALTASNCTTAKVAAVGWGARCTDDACTSATWEKIGGPTQATGHWNTVSNVCYVGVSFAQADKSKKYKTLNIDIIATVVENGKTVRKRAKGTITARIGNGKCVSVPAKARK